MLAKSKPSSAQLRGLIADLIAADKIVKTDPNVAVRELRDLRHALDNLRLAAWTANEWQNAREARKDARAMVSFLTAERLRRIRQMVDDLRADLEHNAATWPANNVTELLASLHLFLEQLRSAAARDLSVTLEP